MNDRIKEFMQAEGLTSVKFAEIMEVQPSSISHLLAGRNYPNFDFLSKILLRFPTLNPDWIINGKGDIYRSNPNVGNNVNNTEEAEITYVKHEQLGTPGGLFTNVITEEEGILPENNQDVKDVNSTSGLSEVVENEQINVTEELPIAKVTSVTTPADLTQSNSAEIDSILPSGKASSITTSIDQIVIFYADGTFKEYTKR